MLDRHVLFIMHFLFSFVILLEYPWVFGPFTITNMYLEFEKSACPFGQVKTKMYLPVRPFFKNSLARASRLVLMSVPDELGYEKIF